MTLNLRTISNCICVAGETGNYALTLQLQENLKLYEIFLYSHFIQQIACLIQGWRHTIINVLLYKT